MCSMNRIYHHNVRYQGIEVDMVPLRRQFLFKGGEPLLKSNFLPSQSFHLMFILSFFSTQRLQIENEELVTSK